MSDYNYQFKVSVIVPIFNVSNYLEKSVLSLLHQTLDGIEFIFVDDNSTDDSFTKLSAIIDRYPDLKNNIQVTRHDYNKGVATTRNTGLSLARGKYLAAMDPDDWIDSDMLERMYQKMEESRSDIVWCDYYNDYNSHEDYISQKSVETPYGCITSMLRGEILGGMCNKLVSSSLFRDHNIRFPDGLNMCEDLRVCVQLFYYAKKVVHIEQAFYHYMKYRIDSISTSSANLPVLNIGWIENVKGIDLFLKEKGIENMDESIALLKLIPKQNLLVRGHSLSTFKQWREVFPESNNYVWKGDLPLHYKILANSIVKNRWIIPRIWLFMKKLKGRVVN
jgi:glycosyltransferase involved in cell wall biosynthesis